MAESEPAQDTQSEAKSLDEYEEEIAELQEQYVFYLLNPAHSNGVEYSLWLSEDDEEFPLINSNTGGFVTFHSRDDDVGEALELTQEFFFLVGFGWHEAICFMPDIYFREDHFERRARSVYDGALRDHEVWLAQVLIDWMCHGGQMVPELEPLCEWANQFSDFEMPRLGGEASAE